ncbi:MAG: hypothetical protein R3C03_23890 [Pirellulaceae bacterium]
MIVIFAEDLSQDTGLSRIIALNNGGNGRGIVGSSASTQSIRWFQLHEWRFSVVTYIFHSSTSNVMRFMLDVAGLTNASSGLSIATICSNEETPTVYAVDSSNVETITTLGTYSAPSTNKCRFKEVDATNTPKLYEFQLLTHVSRSQVRSGSTFSLRGQEPIHHLFACCCHRVPQLTASNTKR